MIETWWWSSDDPEKKNCAGKLCRENTFLYKRECWCNCNFRMYSSVYLMYFNPMFILGCVCNIIESCHTLMFIPGSFYSVISHVKSLWVTLLLVKGWSPHSCGALGLLEYPREVNLRWVIVSQGNSPHHCVKDKPPCWLEEATSPQVVGH